MNKIYTYNSIKGFKERKSQSFFAKCAPHIIRNSVTLKEFKKDNGSIEHKLTLQFADYTQIDDAKDLLLFGCMAESLKKNDGNRIIPLCWQHDVKDAIGRPEKIWEEEKGAFGTFILSDFDAVPNAKRAWVQAKEGLLNQASFGYRYDWDNTHYDEAKECWVVKNLFLHEVSIVTLGCNSLTQVVSEEEEEIDGKELEIPSMFARIIS